jgi:hypothetical protein
VDDHATIEYGEEVLGLLVLHHPHLSEERALGGVWVVGWLGSWVVVKKSSVTSLDMPSILSSKSTVSRAEEPFSWIDEFLVDWWVDGGDAFAHG